MIEHDDYLDSRVMTASPEQLHLMVVDGSLRHCMAARVAMEQSDREKAWSALSEARAHVAELLSGISQEEHEILDNMRAIFTFVLRQLTTADTEQKIERIDAAMKLLQVHRETWVALINQLASNTDHDRRQPRGDEPTLRVGA